MIRPAELIQRKRDGEELPDGELSELILGYARGEISATHLLGRHNETADRTGKVGGEVDPNRHCGNEEQHRDHHEDQGKGDLEPRSLTFQLLVLGGGALCLLHMVEHPRFDVAANIEIHIAELVEANESAHPIVREYVSDARGGIRVYEPQPRTQVEAAEPAEANQTYLIAFKDHTIYAALAYWVEGNTLHYVTNQNTHNQVSLDLVDRELSSRLNRERSVDFRLPPAGR